MKTAVRKSDGSGACMTRQVVIETPRGCRNKYKFDEESGRMKLSKVMPEGMVFPYDFGFFPGTQSDDGDPLDVLVLNDEPTFPGFQIDCRPIGAILARQHDKGGEEVENDRIIAVAEASFLYAGVHELAELEPKVLKQVEDFFVNYQKVREVQVFVKGHAEAKEANRFVEHASIRHRRSGPSKSAAA